MKKTQSLAIARKKKECILLFSNKSYSIIQIPYNYKVLVKLPHKAKHRTINKDFYCPLEYGVAYAHEMAKEKINKYFKN